MLLLKFLRIDQGYSQADLAKVVHVQQSDVSRFETGRGLPTNVQQQSIALALGCAPERLFEQVARP